MSYSWISAVCLILICFYCARSNGRYFDSQEDSKPAASGYNSNFGGGQDDEIGYLRRSNSKGADGYNNFESFHTKDGDAYGHEKLEGIGISDKSGNIGYNGGYNAGYSVHEEPPPSEALSSGYNKAEDNYSNAGSQYADHGAQASGKRQYTYDFEDLNPHFAFASDADSDAYTF